MPKRPNNYFRPKTLEEALHLLKQPGSAPLGGGTRLLADDVPVETVVDLQDLGLTEIQTQNGELRVGAMTRLQALYEAEPLATGQAGELLRTAIEHAGPNTFRHAATLGGVVGSQAPDSELLMVLLAMDARLELAGTNQRYVQLAEYLAVNELRGLITAVLIPWSAGKGALYRVARTPADAPIVAVATWKPEKGDIRSAAVGIGSSPTPLLKVDAKLNQHSIDVAISLAQDSVNHPGDFLGSTLYRREMVGVLLRRALETYL